MDPKDVFPEEFAHFLLTDPRVRHTFMAQHRDLLDYLWWQEVQDQIAAGKVGDVIPYQESQRFSRMFADGVTHPRMVRQHVIPNGLASHPRALTAGRRRPLGRFSFDSD